jgi:hypothetical protein
MSDKPKTVQIPLETFVALCKVHLMGLDDQNTLEDIKKALEGKLDALLRHDTYSAYKTADSPREREAARQRYLDKVGVPQDFRW